MALTCKQAARISLATLGGHAAEAELLELEEHLGSCAACGEDHGASLALVHGIGGLEPEGLGTGAREAVRQVIVARPSAARLPRRRVSWGRRPRVLAALAGAAGAAAVAAAVAVLGGGVLGPRADAVLGGDVTIAPAVAGVGYVGDVDGTGAATYRSASGGRVRLAAAHVDLGRATEIGWNRGARRVELRRGSLIVDVEHRAGERFEVLTPRFTVVVVGTRFTVDLDGVRTERGIVQVVRPDGSIAARVEAGQAWRADADAAAPQPAPPPVAAQVALAPPVAPTERAPRPQRAPPPEPSAATRLADARRALALGDAPAARQMVAPLFHLSRDVGVEARILFAESFLTEGRYADAIDGYRLVVRDFPGTSQAENAQFALAQLASEHGAAADARAALQAYLARYPHGRFAREAAQRLAQPAPRER
jgi:hypothetical protein